MYIHRDSRKWYRFEIVDLVYAITFCMLALILYSYDAYDPSFLYYTTDTVMIHNYAGSIGAHIAALFWYMWGGASYVILISLLLLWRAHKNAHKVTDMWEYVASAVVLPFVCAAYLHLYSIDLCASAVPGGLVGMQLNYLFTFLCGPVCAALFIHLLIIILLFISCGSFFIHTASYTVRACYFLYTLLRNYKVIERMGAMAVFVVKRGVIQPVHIIILFFARLIDGSLFNGSDLVVPADRPEHMQDLIELHQMLQRNAGIPDQMISGATVDKESVSGSYDVQQEVDALIKEKDILLAGSHGVARKNEHDSAAGHDVMEDAAQEQKIVYTLPSVDLFIGVVQERTDQGLKQELQERAALLEKKLERFGVKGTVTAIKRGPVVTLFEYLPHIDTKLSKIVGLEDDLAMALQALSIRIIAPIPGKALVGFEVANVNRLDVTFASIIKTDAYLNFSGALPLVLGHDTVGKEVIVDLARMPHLLIAGSTGSGKSVALNVMLISLLCKLSPDQLKLILIDPKRLEFMSYADIGHLLFPIVTDPKKVVHILRWVVKEMEDRYERMAALGVRHIFDYNKKIAMCHDPILLPFIVVVIDELSDLMLTVGRDIEDLITRITQMARAAGIHMVVATQRPSVDVITGLIKVNFPSRISFRVTSRIDSRTILDCNGADKLLGRGDMLFLDAVNAQLSRVHGAFVSTAQIEKVVAHVRTQGQPIYVILGESYDNDKQNNEIEDELYEQVLLFLKETDDISISLLQRRFHIGYNRSARIIDMLESHGLIMPVDGAKKRKVVR